MDDVPPTDPSTATLLVPRVILKAKGPFVGTWAIDKKLVQGLAILGISEMRKVLAVVMVLPPWHTFTMVWLGVVVGEISRP